MVWMHRLTDWLVNGLKQAGAFALTAMMLLTCIDVIGRFFGRPIFGAVEVVSLLATVCLACAMPLTHAAKGHVGVDLLMRRIRPDNQAVVDLTAGLATLILFLIVAWRMFLYGASLRASGEVSMTLQLPTYLLVYLVGAAFIVLAFVILGELVRLFGEEANKPRLAGLAATVAVALVLLGYAALGLDPEPMVIGIIGIVVLIAALFSRMPVAYCMALIGFLGFSYKVSGSAGLNLLARDFYDVYSSYGLTTIPLFVLMGQIAFNAGISRRLYDAAYTFVGSYRGGLATATVCACTAFGAVCGSSPATAATMATVGLPEMKRYGYGRELACGSVASGGGLGMLMPPSVVLIVYGILTEQSIGRLFVAGIVPALFITVLFSAAVWVYCLFKPDQGPAGEKFTWAQKIRSLSETGETMVVFILVMGGLFLGIFTPTEAGAVGAFTVFLVAFVRRSITWAGFVKSLHETLRTSCMVLLLVAGAVVFGHFLAVTRIPFEVARWVAGLDLPGYAIVALIVSVYLIGGCFIDALALIMLTIPIFYPIILDLGYDPIWFGVIIVLVTQMGVITPPVGINVYVVNGIDQETPLEDIFRGVLPFLAALVLGTAFIVVFPQLAVWLPNLMYG